MQFSGLLTRLGLVQLHQLDRTVGGAGKAVQHLRRAFHDPFQGSPVPLIEPGIGRREFRKIASVLPRVMAVQIAHQQVAEAGQAQRRILPLPIDPCPDRLRCRSRTSSDKRRNPSMRAPSQLRVFSWKPGMIRPALARILRQEKTHFVRHVRRFECPDLQA